MCNILLLLYIIHSFFVHKNEQKNATHATTACAFDNDRITMSRTQPLTLEQLLNKKKIMYRNQMDTSENKAIPTFIGPGGVSLQEPEVSFGLLFATSLRRSLANDLRKQAILLGCISNSEESLVLSSNLWQGGSFLQNYDVDRINNNNNTATTSLVGTPLLGENCTSQLPLPLSTTTKNATSPQLNNQQQAMAIDAALWNASDWTWSFIVVAQDAVSTSSTNYSNTTTTKTRGSINREMWMQDRFAACNASYNVLTSTTTTTQQTTSDSANNNNKEQGGMAIRPITLCEPAPTAGLQTLCKAMLQYRTSIQTINCEIMGGGSCLYRPGTFYVPYVWSATNQEFAADTVISYYRNILNQPRFVNETYTKVCPSRNSLLDRLTLLSQIQAKQCPANQIEYLKGIMQSIKNIGHDLLYMGYCLVMFVANILGMAYSQDAFSMNSMLEMAKSYMLQFITTAEEIIMPILNAIVNLIFGVSSTGRVLKNALVFLCEYYNYLIQNIYIPIWCTIIRPALYVIFNTLEGIVVPFSRDAANKIDAVWVAIAGGDGGIGISDTAQCIGSLKIHIDCGGDSMHTADNASDKTFETAALATLCWTDSSASSSLGGAGILGGISSASYLSCTASDTCALDPLNFDSYNSNQDLVPCTSCPMLSSSDSSGTSAYRFGCDTYLKRCTCGISSNTPAQCMSNSDCSSSSQQKSGAICAVTSNLDLVNQATTYLPCSECSSMGMQPACVFSSNIAPICACVAVAQIGTLQTCSNRGQSVSLLQATGQCLATSNYDLQRNTLSVDLVLDFGTLIIAPCILGLSENGCIGVSLPLPSGGQYARSLVVLFLTSSSSSSFLSSSTSNSNFWGGGGTGGGRRMRHLLDYSNGNSISNQRHLLVLSSAIGADPTTAITTTKTVHSKNTEKIETELILDENQTLAILQNWEHTPLFCKKAISTQNRENVKWCLHWRFAAISLLTMFDRDIELPTTTATKKTFMDHIIDLFIDRTPHQPHKDEDDAILLSWTFLLKNPSMIFYIASNQKAANFFLRQHRAGLFPILMDTAASIFAHSLQTLKPLFIYNNNSNNTTHIHANATEKKENSSKSTRVENSTSSSQGDIHHQVRKLWQYPPTLNKNMGSIPASNRRNLPQEPALTSTVSQLSCKALDKPLQAIASAFWDTVAYYQYISSSNSQKNDTNITTSAQVNASNNSNINGNFTIAGLMINNNNKNGRYTLQFDLPVPQDFDIIDNQRVTGGDFADLVFGGYGRSIIAAFSSQEKYNETSNLITGRRLLKELSYCNYTSLILKKTTNTTPVPLFYLAIITGLFFVLLTTLCVPSSSCLTWIIWTILFPMVFFWLAYGISPLCWPMIPPSLPHDIAVEVASIIPESLEIPRFLVEDHCTIRGLLSDGTYDPRCFKRCQHAPFLMQSWQDALAWWLCDLSQATCIEAAQAAERWSILQDFASSSAYFAQVVAFEELDPDFTAAHRLCAFFTSHQIVFAITIFIFAILVIPSVILGIMEIFAGAIVLLMQARSSEIMDT